jgi:hypothetical protein
MIMGFSLLFFMYKKLFIKIEFKIFIRKILLRNTNHEIVLI